jgi:hypothetical protein
MKSIKANLSKIVMLGLGVLLLSGCNKGVGCPNNFSLDINLVDILGAVFSVL